MPFRVVLQRAAIRDLAEAHAWAAERAPHAADRWLTKFETALGSLANHPERRPYAREHGKLDLELREFLFGKSPYVFRAIFTLDDQTVRVLRIRRAQRRSLSQSELERSLDLDA